MSDPKLKEAMKEIETILFKHDICGSIILASQTHAENRFLFNSSWSACYFESNGYLKIKALEKDFKTKEQHQKCITETVGMLYQFRDLNALNYNSMDKMCVMLEVNYDITHEPLKDFEPHKE